MDCRKLRCIAEPDVVSKGFSYLYSGGIYQRMKQIRPTVLSLIWLSAVNFCPSSIVKFSATTLDFHPPLYLFNVCIFTPAFDNSNADAWPVFRIYKPR